ncbi:hypothetical protein [Streptomyces capitiformicae]|uniref:hypothetical protein n=1 Tax=Streptomyces capitiformicae TaxID=2014920 RepID=UPI001678A470|nr:hypothetical protein [Streptomyces capitiformicae]
MVAGLVLVCVLPLAGCGSATPSADAAPASPPIVSTTEADRVLTAYDVGNNKVNSTADAAGLAKIESTPLRVASEAELEANKVLDQSIPLIKSTDQRFMIPSRSADLPWFVSISTRLHGGVVATNQTYTVFKRQDKGAPWLAAYSLTPPADVQVPAVTLNGASAATAVNDFGDLALQPDELAQRIFAHYKQDVAGRDIFGTSAVLDDQLGNGFKAALRVLRGKGTQLVRTVKPGPPQAFALRTADGGALVFSTSTVVDVLKPLDPSGTVSLSAGSDEAALLGKAAGATAPGFTITRQQNFLTHIPTQASGEPVVVLAYTDFPVSVR